MTDEGGQYVRLGKEFAKHGFVDHSREEYAYTDRKTGVVIGINTAEGYFSIFERGMIGIYQHCKEKHLHRYLAEYDFRYSNRIRLGVDDEMRTERALAGIVGKRLTYPGLVTGPGLKHPRDGMSDSDEFRLKIEAYTPDTMPMERLAEYLAELALMLGERTFVHFVRLEAGSTSIVHRIPTLQRSKLGPHPFVEELGLEIPFALIAKSIGCFGMTMGAQCGKRKRAKRRLLSSRKGRCRRAGDRNLSGGDLLTEK